MRACVLSLAVACGSAAPRPATAPATPPTAPTPAPAIVRASPMLVTPLAPSDEKTTFALWKFAWQIGVEIDTYASGPAGGTDAKAVFAFRDRGSMVPLAAEVAFDREGRIVTYRAWGSSARGAFLDDRVTAAPDGGFDVGRLHQPARHVAASSTYAVVASTYAPMLTQELAIRAWLQHGRPAKTALLPEGEIAIESRGQETYDHDGGKLALEHLAITGLVWGREDVWIDDKARLIAAITRDDEFDHFEATRSGFGALLPKLLQRAASDGTAWLAANATTAQLHAGKSIALVGGRLIDGTNRPAIEDAVVVIAGDKIVAAGPRDKVAIPAEAAQIDVRGKSIVAGLWDMHAHLEQVEQGATYLAGGITTVRDMGNIFDFITGIRDSIDGGAGLGPRVIASCLVDGDGEQALGALRIKSQRDIAPMVDKLVAARCAEIKLYSSVSPELVKPIIAYAHQRGLRAVGHVPDGMTTREAIAAGYDSVSHLNYLFDVVMSRAVAKELSRDEVLKRTIAFDLKSPEMTKLIDEIVARKIVIDDTVALFEMFQHTLAEEEKREPGIATLPRELRVGLPSISEQDAPLAGAMFAKQVDLIRLLHQRGAIIVAGTDIAVPSHSVHRELEIYVEAGFTPLEAIQAASIVPARAMRRDKELGTVEVGKLADVIVVDGNPLARIGDLRRVSLVIARGHAYDPRPLWKLAGFGLLP